MCAGISVFFSWFAITMFALKPANGVPIYVPFFYIKQVYPKWNILFRRMIFMKSNMEFVEKSVGSYFLFSFNKDMTVAIASSVFILGCIATVSVVNSFETGGKG